ncbi:lipocalin-like [Chanos chanos]|uniref:Lipocalin-like n=1 Tax=Chanos chanos TaxID=29144 RepID=A0A6J2V003_CHACN|nr:lipocalin-like [Chanos chanos]
MAAAVLRLFGVLLCALIACAEVMPMSDFDLQGMSGKWFIIGFATNAEWFVSHKDNMKMGTAMLVPTESGDLDITYANLQSDGSCWRMTHLAKKTDVPGRFTFRSQRWNNDNDWRVVEAKFDEYALVHTIKTQNGATEVLNKLYGRATSLSPELLQKFKKLSQDTGIFPENIVILPPNGECADA